jgi:putative colanic acid biosynthesis acetyltransferase WcaB
MGKLREDFSFNKNNTKGLLFIMVFRFCSFFAKKKIPKPFNYIIKLIIELPYTIIVQWFLNIDIPCTTNIGKGFQLYHGHGTVINSKCIIGDYVKIRHNTTIGNSKKNGKCPIIGSYVDIGSNSVIIGEILVGDNVKIGALTLVNKDVSANATVVGIPFKIIS